MAETIEIEVTDAQYAAYQHACEQLGENPMDATIQRNVIETIGKAIRHIKEEGGPTRY